MATEGATSRSSPSRSRPLPPQEMAGLEVSVNGLSWVSSEVLCRALADQFERFFAIYDDRLEALAPPPLDERPKVPAWGVRYPDWPVSGVSARPSPTERPSPESP